MTKNLIFFHIVYPLGFFVIFFGYCLLKLLSKKARKRKYTLIYKKTTLKNIKLENIRLWWNTWFLVQEIHLHSRQTSFRNEQMPTKSTRTQRKDKIDPKGPKQRNRHKQLPTHNLPTDDVENINSTNRGRDSLLANKARIDPPGRERLPQRIQKCSRVTLHRSS